VNINDRRRPARRRDVLICGEETCGKEVVRTSHRQRFCSDACRKKSERSQEGYWCVESREGLWGSDSLKFVRIEPKNSHENSGQLWPISDIEKMDLRRKAWICEIIAAHAWREVISTDGVRCLQVAA
jgi:hypothetical protein